VSVLYGEDVKPPLVSVILPTRDRAKYLSRAVASVLAQSEQDIELIVVNDASSDGTREYLDRLAAQDGRVRVVQNAVAMGGAGARNAGIAFGRGKWIAFLDDDDEWMPMKLQRQLEKLRANASAVACSCSYVVSFSSGWSRLVAVPAFLTLGQLLVDNQLGSSSLCICSSNVLRDIGGFDIKFKSAQDHDLWVRLRQKGDVEVCSEALVLYHSHREIRITNNMHTQYVGARHFYLKHRNLMDEPLRRRRLSYNCFIMSRQVNRSLRHRIRYLILSLLNSPMGSSLSYARSSMPRLVRDAALGSLKLWK
jgi:glycosyltransferase involved in cell wall biosynthesis